MRRIAIPAMALAASTLIVLIALVAEGRQAVAQLTTGLTPRLGDIMGAVQLRHFKLWFAGDMNNWPLAGYELRQIHDSFSDAAMLYENVPLGDIEVSMIEKPLAALGDAIKAKDHAKFARAFSDLTGTCNHCHQAAQVGYIVVRIPTASPFSNQSFAPIQK